MNICNNKAKISFLVDSIHRINVRNVPQVTANAYLRWCICCNMARILLIEDDPTFVITIETFLGKLGHQVTSYSRISEGKTAVKKGAYDLVILDYRLPDGVGLDLLPLIKEGNPGAPVIVMTSFSDLRTAVRAMKMGAYDYITKPVVPDELKHLIEQAFSRKEQQSKTTRPVSAVSAAPKDYVEGNSAMSRHLHDHINLVAPTDMTVLILGESGTGKEYVARAIHANSKRKNKPFVAVDCGALSEELAFSELFGHEKGAFTGAIKDKPGKFVEADGGTLFLDEVGNLSYEVQVKLLRALQERVIQPLGSNKIIPVDNRIITATNERLKDLVAEGKFREDLYHRLNEFKIDVPALRNRREDFMEFAEFFREKANEELERDTLGFSDEVVTVFKSYSWPGNLRELKNTVKRSVLLSKNGGLIDKLTLPPEMFTTAVETATAPKSEFDLKAQQADSEKEIIMKTLVSARYNKSKAAKLLNIDRKTLYLKLEKYGISL